MDEFKMDTKATADSHREPAEGSNDKTVIKPGVKLNPSISDRKTVVMPDKPATVNEPLDDDANHTVIKPCAPQPASSLERVAGNISIEETPEEALTRIKNYIESADGSTGFVKAKQTVNRALAENKIILNKRFVLEEVLGSGGMGTVYRAKDLRKVEADDLQPDVAVKVLNENFKYHPDAFVTLEREASRSHTLSHPNIVTVHDFDRDDDLIYMTMEILNGQPLDELLRQHEGIGLEKDRAFSIIDDICQALVYAHKKSIIHSDLKPGNVFVTDDGAKVLDFGIARSASGAQNDFDAGSLGALTPAYASLEMIEQQQPDPRDDVYAAGIIAYELLCGRHPFDRRPADIALKKHLKPQRIKQLSNREWQALDNALQLKQAKRTPSIDAFRRELTNKYKFPFLKIASALLIVMVAGLVYQRVYAPDKVSMLAEQTFAKGTACFQKGDFPCAIEDSKTVLGITPQHKGAKRLLQNSQESLHATQVENAEAEIDKCLKIQGDLACAKAQLAALTKLAPQTKILQEHEEEVADFEQQQTIDSNLSAAQTCLDSKNYPCAVQRSDRILELEPDNASAAAIKNQAAASVEAEKNKSLINTQQYQQAMKNAQQCFDKADHACARRFTHKALALKPNDVDARFLNKRVTDAEQKNQKNIKNANKFVEEANTYFKRKEYVSAIAMSKSALAIFPDYKPALALQDKAKSAQQNDKQKAIDSIDIK